MGEARLQLAEAGEVAAGEQQAVVEVHSTRVLPAARCAVEEAPVAQRVAVQAV